MKKKNGFTLIELLAVIVILAIIALIATPIIMSVIRDAKVGAAKDSMFGYVKAVELAGTQYVKATTDAPSGTYITNAGNLYQKSIKSLDITFKGTRPEDNFGTVILTNGTVKYAKLKFDGIEVEYDGSKVRTDNFIKTYSVGDVIYFDPTGTVKDCNASKIWTSSNTETTCYKWNVIKENITDVELLLDHNTTENVAWNLIANNGFGPLEVYNQLKTDTSHWSMVETLTSSDNAVRDTVNKKPYTIIYEGMKARLISAQEVADIVGDTKWTPSNYTAIIYASTPWINQNTKGKGDDNNLGYWTDTVNDSNSTTVWYIDSIGHLSHGKVEIKSAYGVRPVVKVLKSNL